MSGSDVWCCDKGVVLFETRGVTLAVIFIIGVLI